MEPLPKWARLSSWERGLRDLRHRLAGASASRCGGRRGPALARDARARGELGRRAHTVARAFAAPGREGLWRSRGRDARLARRAARPGARTPRHLRLLARRALRALCVRTRAAPLGVRVPLGLGLVRGLGRLAARERAGRRRALRVLLGGEEGEARGAAVSPRRGGPRGLRGNPARARLRGGRDARPRQPHAAHGRAPVRRPRRARLC